MAHPWRLTLALVGVSAAAAVALRTPILWVHWAPRPGWVIAGTYWFVFLAAMLVAAVVGWMYADAAGQHVSRWGESVLLGTFVGWVPGYVVAELLLPAPAIHREVAAFTLAQTGFQQYASTGVVLAFAAFAGVGMARALEGRTADTPMHRSTGTPAVIGAGAGMLVGLLWFLNPRAPWDPDVLGLTQFLLTAAIPFVAFVSIFSGGWVASHRTGNGRVGLISMLALGGAIGGIAARAGWDVAVEPVVWSVDAVLFAAFLGLPAATVAFAGVVGGRHGLSDPEVARLREIRAGYTREQRR